MGVALSFDIFAYDSSHAETLHGLIERAFSIVPPQARPKDSKAYLDYMQGPANPSGPAIVAVARTGDTCIGNISATPFRFTTTSGQALTGYQLGSVVIDAAYQRQGIGTKLVGEITRHLAGIDDAFTYIYPNPRSYPVLLNSGYAAARDVPTYIHFPWAASFPGLRPTARRWTFADGHGGAWQIEMADLDAVINAPGIGGAATVNGFQRDSAYFAWRYGGPGADKRYRFALVRHSQGEVFAVVCASHVFNGLRFVILNDNLSAHMTRHYVPALEAARIIGGHSAERFVYVNSNIPRLLSAAPSADRAPWGMAVPNAVNPRPVRLLYYPVKGINLEVELNASIAMTGDWMGF